jgi:hypothetical protein
LVAWPLWGKVLEEPNSETGRKVGFYFALEQLKIIGGDDPALIFGRLLVPIAVEPANGPG